MSDWFWDWLPKFTHALGGAFATITASILLFRRNIRGLLDVVKRVEKLERTTKLNRGRLQHVVDEIEGMKGEFSSGQHNVVISVEEMSKAMDRRFAKLERQVQAALYPPAAD